MTLNTVTGDGTVKEIISSANFQIDNMVSFKTGVATEAVKGLSGIGNLTRCCILAHRRELNYSMKSTVVKGTCNPSQ